MQPGGGRAAQSGGERSIGGREGKSGSQGGAVQAFGLGGGADAEFGVEGFAALVILAQGAAALSLAQAGVDEQAVGEFLGGAGGEDLFGAGGGVSVPPLVEVGGGEAEQKLFAQLREPGAPGLGPVRVPVLREQFAGELAYSVCKLFGPAVGEGVLGGLFGVVGVDPDGGVVEEQQSAVSPEVGGGGAGASSGSRACRAACRATRRLPAADCGSASGQHSSMTSSRCRQWPEATARTLTRVRAPGRGQRSVSGGPESRSARNPLKRWRRSMGGAVSVRFVSRAPIRSTTVHEQAEYPAGRRLRGTRLPLIQMVMRGSREGFRRA
ncbi:hypothetical protein GCM10025734_04720 [Kitasatospora paranensis]